MSLEEGEFEALPEDLIGKVLPLCFGTVTNVPALRAVPTISGLLLNGVGIKDFTLGNRINLAELITCPQTPIGYKCSGAYPLVTCNVAYEEDQNCLQARCLELELLKLQLAEQSAYEYNEITIFNGELFPQGEEITLNIDGGLFTGTFRGTATDPVNVFAIRTRQHPRYDPSTGSVSKDPVQTALESACPGESFRSEDSNFVDSIHGPLWTGQRNSRISWENFREAARADFFWAPGGANVSIEDFKEIVYVANILPSVVHSVKAIRTVNGNDFLLTVPAEFYETRLTDYNGYTVTEIVFQRPLSAESKETGGGWKDEIYVSLTSPIGPNTVSILKWIIQTYTSYEIDDPSFDDAETKLENYPQHFPLLTRPNLLSILQDVARQARCALWQRDDKFFIRYLPEEPTPVTTLTYDDILKTSPDEDGQSTLMIELTDTEDLVTKSVNEWRQDYGPFTEEANRLVLRYRMKRYGTHEEMNNYFTFRHLDLVRKSATYWLIRQGNSWKRVTCKVGLEFAFLEPFDPVLIDLPDLANEPVIGLVERAVLDTGPAKEISLELWTPVRSGEMTAYDFAYPANIAEASLFPTLAERNLGDAGSGNDPNFSVITPPGHPLTPDRTGIFSGFGLACNGAPVTTLGSGECRQDHGDRNPSDEGDKKPGVDTPTDNTGNVSGSTSPVSNGSGFGFGSSQWLQQEHAKKNEGDAGRGREVGEGGGSGDSPGSGDNNDPVEQELTQDDLDQLPNPDDIEGFKCVVVIVAFRTESSFQGVPTQEVCTPDGQAFTERYAFDSFDAAADFCSARNGRPSCGGMPPCDTCISCTASCSGDPEDEGDGNLIGYDPGNNSGTPIILE